MSNATIILPKPSHVEEGYGFLVKGDSDTLYAMMGGKAVMSHRASAHFLMLSKSPYTIVYQDVARSLVGDSSMVRKGQAIAVAERHDTVVISPFIGRPIYWKHLDLAKYCSGCKVVPFN
jgi:hypothetical protein